VLLTGEKQDIIVIPNRFFVLIILQRLEFNILLQYMASYFDYRAMLK